MYLSTIKRIHLVGIGGIGMSGLAEILKNKGFKVTGSDIDYNDNIERLRGKGIEIKLGHDKNNINNPDLIIYSAAVKESNIELKEGARKGINIVKRARVLAELTRLHFCIGVAGTHGKTTTTSIIGSILMNTRYDPTVIVGGKLHAFGNSNIRLGSGEFMVVEADEYDRSFLELSPAVGIINTIDNDHMDTYEDIEDIKKAFLSYANKIPFYGFVALGIDDDNVNNIKNMINVNIVTYGTKRKADYRATNITQESNKTRFTLTINNRIKTTINISLPGIYNVNNALAAIATTHKLGLKLSDIEKAISKYTNVYRRFDIKGIYNDIMVIDDYAHHPTEIRETIKGAKKGWNKRIIVVFQPHTYSRTKALSKEFAEAISLSDIFIVTDIYPAREKAMRGVSGNIIVREANNMGYTQGLYIKNKNDIANNIINIVKREDMVIFMGAGDIYMQIDVFIKYLKKMHA